MEISADIVAGKKVLLLWHGGCNPEKMKTTVEDLRSKTGPGGGVSLEHSERLIMGKCNHSMCCFAFNELEKIQLKC